LSIKQQGQKKEKEKEKLSIKQQGKEKRKEKKESWFVRTIRPREKRKGKRERERS